MKNKNQKEGCRHIYFGPLSATLKKHLTLFLSNKKYKPYNKKIYSFLNLSVL